MYLRLVRVKAEVRNVPALVELYRERIIPALEQVQGCRYAGFMQSAFHAEECLSLTLWDAQADADAYEKSGLFASLLEKSKPHLVESSEFHIRLSENLTLEYVAVPEKPVVQAMSVSAKSVPDAQRQSVGNTRWLRTVVLKLRPGKMEEFKLDFADRIIPALREVKGCRFVYLTEVPERPNEVVSITSWETEEDAMNYERSRMFQMLLESQQHLLSDLYQWKRKQDRSRTGTTATSEDVAIEHYSVLAGKDFSP